MAKVVCRPINETRGSMLGSLRAELSLEGLGSLGDRGLEHKCSPEKRTRATHQPGDKGSYGAWDHSRPNQHSQLGAHPQKEERKGGKAEGGAERRCSQGEGCRKSPHFS